MLLSLYSFLVKGITDLLNSGVPLEDVEHLAGQCSPRTTKLLQPAAEESHAEHRRADFYLRPRRIPTAVGGCDLLSPNSLRAARMTE